MWVVGWPGGGGRRFQAATRGGKGQGVMPWGTRTGSRLMPGDTPGGESRVRRLVAPRIPAHEPPPHPASPAAPCQGLGAHMGGAPPAAAAAGPAAPAPPLPEPTAPVGPLVAFLFFSNYPIFDRFNGGEVKI